MIRTVVIATFTIFLLISPFIAHADVYKWTDEKGTVHFTDDESTIPEKYRQQVEKTVLPEISKSKTDGGKTESKPAEIPLPGSTEQDAPLWLSGVISTVGAGMIVVTNAGKDATFLIANDTRIKTGDEKDVSFGELKKGRPVTIEYVKQGDENVARSIRVTLFQEKAPPAVEQQEGGAGQMQNPSDVQKRVWEDTKTHQAPRLPQLPKK